MKAIRIHTYGDVNTLQLEEAPTLAIESDQLLVRIRDAGVNPIDWKIREGYLKSRMPANFPLTMGQDFAGEVVEQGKDVQSLTSAIGCSASRKVRTQNTPRPPHPQCRQSPVP